MLRALASAVRGFSPDPGNVTVIIKTKAKILQGKDMEQELLEQLKRQNRLLKQGLLLAGAGLTVLTLAAAKAPDPSARFGEISVERINVVGPDGKNEMVIANRHRLPDAIVDGKPIKSDRGQKPGIIFYNADGDENGGLIFDGKLGDDGKPVAGMHFSMDRHGGDQQLALGHYEQGGYMESGLTVFDRGLHKDYDPLYKAWQELPAGAEKEAAKQRWIDAGGKQTKRLFIGKTPGKSSALVMADAHGKPRIMMIVTPEGKPELTFYGDDGKVLQKLPADNTPPVSAQAPK